MLAKLHVDELRDHRAVNLFDELRIGAELRCERFDVRDDLLYAIGRANGSGGRLESCRLPHEAGTIGKQCHDLPIDTVDASANLGERAACACGRTESSMSTTLNAR